MADPLAIHNHVPGEVDLALEFLKRTRNELRPLRMVRVWKDKLQIFDINGDSFEILGVGYPDADIVPILHNLGTAFNPETIHQPTREEYKEFKTGKQRPWAEHRVM
jgi:hypothetical protein